MTVEMVEQLADLLFIKDFDLPRLGAGFSLNTLHW